MSGPAGKKSVDPLSRLSDLVAELLDDTPKRLVAAYGDDKISRDTLHKKLAAMFHNEFGGPIRGLAEHDREAAQEFGLTLRRRIDQLLAELGAGDSLPASGQRQPDAEHVKDKTDDVLRREYAIIKALAGSDQALRSSELYEIVKALDPATNDMTITANLVRLANAGTIGKARKGQYHGTAQSRSYLKDLRAEIDARGLPLPRT
jgi:hypothetical protein